MRSARRVPWPLTPPELRSAVQRLIGSEVVEHRTQHGGFSEGMASRLLCADGSTAFVKAVEPGGDSFARALYEREAGIAPWLPPDVPAPRFLGALREGGWLALVFEDAGGHAVPLPWDRSELERVVGRLSRMSVRTASCPGLVLEPWGGEAAAWSHWRRLREDPTTRDRLAPCWHDRLDALAALEEGLGAARLGDTLIHGDLRSDNIVVRPDGDVMFVDWAQAATGAEWIDPLILALCAAVQGVPDPDAVLASHPAGARAPGGHVDSVLAALAGRFVEISATPGPTAVRAFQRAEADVTLRWLARRLDGDASCGEPSGLMPGGRRASGRR
ncbi:aminoglycoside phosphotransferase family protein [Streptomyces anulatus]|uniref:aminoglycoside phosphotransferase family protein n=1 Tax=Streptomyces anulatus TaxID=1892 RepID=UPI0036F7A3E9